MITGFVTVSPNGRLMAPCLDAVPDWLDLAGMLPVGWNTTVDGFRQTSAYLFGARSPSSSYACTRFGIGTGTTPTNTSMTDLESPLAFFDPGGGGLLTTKPITSVSYPSAYVASVQMTLAQTEGNGILITELGLYAYDSGSSTAILLARKFMPAGLQKDGGASMDFAWNIRF